MLSDCENAQHGKRTSYTRSEFHVLLVRRIKFSQKLPTTLTSGPNTQAGHTVDYVDRSNPKNYYLHSGSVPNRPVPRHVIALDDAIIYHMLAKFPGHYEI